MERWDEEGGLGRLPTVLLVLLGGLLWLGFGFERGLERLFAQFGAFPELDGGKVVGLVAAAAAAGAALLLLVLLVQALRWQRRTARLLRQREDELSQQRERVSRYVADLERIAEVSAHDLQEPLRSMIAYSQLLSSREQGCSETEMHDYLNHVVDGARRMRSLVSGLRQFAAVDSSPRTGEASSAMAAMAVARQRLAAELEASGAVLVVDPLPEVQADHASLVEIFFQLLGNALRYAQPGRRPVLHVSVDRAGDAARVTVADNGVGIDPARLTRMFEVFYRPHGGNAGPGTGLATVRRLVERLDGEVWVESELGQGSRFGFSLPLAGLARQRQLLAS